MTTGKMNSIVFGTAAAVALVMLVGGTPRSANAFPAFAKKEKKPCAFCHVKPAGGGPRTEAGKWYKAHGLSLVGFKPGATVKPAAGKPAPNKPAPKKPTKPGAKKG